MIRIPIGGQHLGKVWALVSDEDYERVIVHNWFMIKGGYVVRNAKDSETGQTSRPSLHRTIMNLKPGDGLHVDHIDGNPLNNQRENLRVVTHAQNLQNQSSRRGSSKYRGVSFNKRDGRWTACFMVAGKQKHVGYFDTELEAHHAVSAARAAAMPYSRE